MLRSEIDFPPIPQIDRRRCPECRASMRLAWIEPDKKSGMTVAHLSACIAITRKP